jgi:ATP synthase protein I
VTAAPQEGPSRGKRTARLKQYYSLSALGIEMGVTLAIGLLIGWYLDRWLGTKPWFTIIFAIFGIIAGFRNIIRLARKDWDAEYSGEREDGDG